MSIEEIKIVLDEICRHGFNECDRFQTSIENILTNRGCNLAIIFEKYYTEDTIDEVFITHIEAKIVIKIPDDKIYQSDIAHRTINEEDYEGERMRSYIKCESFTVELFDQLFDNSELFYDKRGLTCYINCDMSEICKSIKELEQFYRSFKKSARK